MHDFPPLYLPHRDLAVTLVSGTDAAACRAVGGRLGGPAVDVRDDDADDWFEREPLGVRIAHDTLKLRERAVSGALTVRLDGAEDLLDVALRFEHEVAARIDSLRADDATLMLAVGAGRVMLRDLVAVTSTEELDREVWGDEPSGDRAPGRLVQRLEIANLVVVVGRDPDNVRARDFIRAINPDARIARLDEIATLRMPEAGVVPGLAHRRAAGLGWQCALGEGVAAVRGSGAIDTVVFRDPRPFHPGRLAWALEAELTPPRCGRILRSRGLVRLASRPHVVGSWSSAGQRLDLEPVAVDLRDAPVGQELVLYGETLREESLEAALGACLLTAEELLAGPEFWESIPDPLPAWQ